MTVLMRHRNEGDQKRHLACVVDLNYLQRLLLTTAGHMGDGAKVWVHATTEDLVLVIEARGRSMHQPLHDPVYHLYPDGSDVEEHAEWLAELFDEEAT